MDIRLPRLGEGADTGTVVTIFVKEGEQIRKDQNIIDLENEKAVASIPSPAGGKVSKIHIQAGQKISVGQLILSLEGASGANGSGQPAAPAAPAAQPQAPAPQQQPRAAAAPAQAQPVAPAQAPSSAAGHLPPAASPSIRKMARDLGLDLGKVQGTERGGRISLQDIRNYIAWLQQAASAGQGQSGATQEGAPAAKPPAEKIDFAKWGKVERKPMSGLRKVISQRMTESWTSIPHVTQFDEVDVTELTALIKKNAAKYEKKGAKLTLTAFTLKAVANTLQKHPIFNASMDESSQEIVYKEYCHIGLAVDTEHGLIVPVIRDVNKKSLLELSKDVIDLAKKTRDRKIGGDELKGGTFTISNQGGIGGAHFTPIINRPELAILGLGRGSQKPMVIGKKIEPRLMMPICLSYDHRLIDGGSAARFTVDLVQAFQQFTEKDL